MARPTKKWRGEPPMQELARRRAQVEDFIARNNQLKSELTLAQKEAKRLMDILRDIAFAEPDKARQIAQRALDRIEQKQEKEAA